MKDFVFISSFRKSVLNAPFKSVFDGVHIFGHASQARSHIKGRERPALVFTECTICTICYP